VPPGRKTLDRFLSRLGFCSRTEAGKLVAAGRVTVNGRGARDADAWVDVVRDRVAVDGKPLRAAQRLYLALHKPKGYVTSFGDPQGRPTVYDLLGSVEAWVAPVGRLDLDTSGLLLLTNDTDFADGVTDPGSAIDKVYEVLCARPVTDAQLERLQRGVELEDGPTRPARVARGDDSRRIELTIHEGRNRQVRRMLAKVGNKVSDLVRVAIGPVRLGDLEPGGWRPLSARERGGLRTRARPALSPRAARASPRRSPR
jgi:pseudouridine synthase